MEPWVWALVLGTKHIDTSIFFLHRIIALYPEKVLFTALRVHPCLVLSDSESPVSWLLVYV
jgi:hypothetical protein